MRVWRWGRASSGKSKKTFGLLIRSCLRRKVPVLDCNPSLFTSFYPRISLSSWPWRGLVRPDSRLSTLNCWRNEGQGSLPDVLHPLANLSC
jgi:hypothetical protein